MKKKKDESSSLKKELQASIRKARTSLDINQTASDKKEATKRKGRIKN